MTNHLARAWQLYELRRDKQAVEEAQRHLAEWPEDAEAFSLLVYASARLRNVEAAQAAADKWVGLAPEEAEAHYGKAIAEKTGSHWSAAEADLAEAIRLDPMNSAFYVLLAEVRVNLSQYEEAVEATEQALAIDPRNASAVFWQGFALWSMNCVRDARTIVQSGLEIDPNDSNLRALLGTMLDYRGHREAAIAHLLEAMRIDPENHWAHERLHAAQRPNDIKIVRIKDRRFGSKGKPREAEEPTHRFVFRAVCVYGALIAFVLWNGYALYRGIVTFFSPKPPESHIFDPRHPNFLRPPLYKRFPSIPRPSSLSNQEQIGRR